MLRQALSIGCQCRNINKLNFPWGTFGATSKPRCFPTYGFLVAECKTGISGGWCRRCQLLQLYISFISHGVLNKIRSDCEVTASSDLSNSSPPHQWRTQGGVSGVQTPPSPRNSEGPPKSCQTQRDCEKCFKKVAEFRTPTPQDVRKKRQ